MIRLRLMGTLDLRRVDATRIDAVLAQPKRLAFLAYLALACPRSFHWRDTLLAVFWPEHDERRARRALRQALCFLRRSLGGDVLSTRGSEEVGVNRKHLRTDVEEVEEALRTSEATNAAVQPVACRDRDLALECLAATVLLDGFQVGGIPAFERWVERERARLRELGRNAGRRLATHAEARGELDVALRRWQLVLRIEPLVEAAARKVIELKLRSGDRAGAVRVWMDLDERYRRLEESPRASTWRGS